VREKRDPKFRFYFLPLPLHPSSHPFFIFTKYNPFFLCIRYAFIHHQPPEKSQRRAKTKDKKRKKTNAIA
jgi:hypothetical protein